MTTQAMATAGGCPHAGIGRDYRPYVHDGMYAFFRRARAEEPVFYNPELGFWVVTRRADVEAVFRDNVNYSAFVASAPVNPLPPELGAYLRASGYTVEPVHVNLDGPEHLRLRQIAARYLNLRTFAGMEDGIRALVRQYIDRLRGKGEVDIVDEMTYALPAEVVLLLMGETGVDPLRIKAWADKRLLLLFGKLDPDELMQAGREIVDFWNYTRVIVTDRMASPRDDYPSYLLRVRGGDDSVLTLNQVESLLFALLLAGHETTTNAIGNLLVELLSSPGQWDRLVADPSLAGQAVEEGLRHASSVVTWRRRALADVEIGGVAIPAGATVLLAIGSANRDEAHYEHGETFDLTRANARDHFAFGKGLHMCLGAPLARLEMRVILEELLRAFPRMRLVPGQHIGWVPTITFRGPLALRVALEG